MAIGGISKYRPQLYQPKNLSFYNKQAARNLSDATKAAADLFASQLTDQGSGMVNLVIKQAVDRIQKQAQAKIAKATASLDKVA